MCSKTLILSSSGLRNLVSGAEQEFEFVFKQQRISMKNVFAEFISPKVSKLHQADPTINRICFDEELKDLTFSKNFISKFNLISKGETITINEEESFEMKIISILLDNEELFNKLNDLYPNEINETNIENYLSNLTFLSQISPPFNFINCSNIIDTISKHFYSIDKNKLKKVPNPILYSIICNSNLLLESEDSLLDFLNEIVSKDENPENIYFYEEIEYSMLSENKFDEFINNFDSSKMTRSLWLKLTQCFYTNTKHSINAINKNRYQTKNNKKESNISQEAYKIIDYLTKEVGGNVHDKGVVNVTASSFGKYLAKNAVDIHNPDNLFFSKNSPNSWLKYDFINRKVHPTSYLITTANDYDTHHPRNWVIDGSNNNIDWEILDSRQYDTSLKGLGVTCKFDIEPYEGSYRYLRIRQTGKNSNNSDYFGFSSLEFIGTLFDDDN